jgi:hypothetical protein
MGGGDAAGGDTAAAPSHPHIATNTTASPSPVVLIVVPSVSPENGDGGATLQGSFDRGTSSVEEKKDARPPSRQGARR